jgi:tetratricopeptide (TPR) repeat protein
MSPSSISADLTVQIERAYRRRRENDFAGALEELEPLLHLVSPPAAALALAGICHAAIHQSRSDLIISLLERAISLAPSVAEYRLELAHYLDAWTETPADRVWELLTEAKRLLERDAVSAAYLEASLLADSDDNDGALRVLEVELKRFPKNALLREAVKRKTGGTNES